MPVHPKTISDLAGLLENIKIIGDIDDPILSGYDQWSKPERKQHSLKCVFYGQAKI